MRAGRGAGPLGIDCFAGSPDEAVGLLVALGASRSGGYICFCNAHVAVTAHRERAVGSALARARAVFPDGAPVAWLQRLLGLAAAKRVAGPDAFVGVVRDGRAKGLRHVVCGGAPGVADAVASELKARYAGADVVGMAAPERNELDDSRLIDRLRSLDADIIWCAFGAPRQELWMAKHAVSLAPALLVGVGAAFDFVAGRRSRAPELLQRLGLEWAHRLAHEPRRLAGRYASTNLRFLFLAAAQLVSKPARSRAAL